MSAFFKFPRTPHLAWLGPGRPRGDKVLTAEEVRALLSHQIVVEEKVDGANIGLSVDNCGELRAQNRGAFLSRSAGHAQFRGVYRWLDSRRTELTRALAPGLVLFGEWCAAVHAIYYTELPDWFLAFDVYDAGVQMFWSSERRSSFARALGIAQVPRLGIGYYSLMDLRTMLGRSRFANGSAEGLYIRADEGEHNVGRAKLVHPDFTQSIGDHWTHRPIRMNRLATPTQ